MSEDWHGRAGYRVAPRPPRRSPPAPRRPPSRRARWHGLSSRAKIGYTSATALMAVTVAISLIAYAFYLHLDGNLHVAAVGGLTNRAEYGVQNILILGSQTRDGQGKGFGYDPHTNLSDNLVLVHLDATHTHALVVSIPRDTMVYEPACRSRLGQGIVPAQQQAIIDGAMNTGGPTCAVATVEHLTGIRMDHFVEFNFNSFRAVVDTLGGVEVCLPQAVNDPFSNLHLSAGKHLISGNQALAFVRTRHGVGNGGDLGRIQLQQEFLSSLIQKVKSQGTLGNALKLFEIANTFTKAVTVDRGLGSISRLVSLAESARNLHTSNVTFITMPTVPDPANTNRLLPVQPEDDLLWQLVQAGTPWRGRLPASRPRSVELSVLNGSGITGLAARTAVGLKKLGFRIAKVGDNPATATTTISYLGSAQAGGAYSLMGALRQAPAVQDGVPGPVTLTIGADFAGVLQPSKAVTRHHQHRGPSAAVSAGQQPAGQQSTVPGQQATIQTRNAAQNICSAMPGANPQVGAPP